jgi:hypothetical protein
MHILKQSLIDKGLVVSSPRVVHETPKIFQHGVVQANRDLRLSRLWLNDGTALGAREVDIAVFLATIFFIEYSLAFVSLPS